MKSNIMSLLLQLFPYHVEGLPKMRLGRNARGGYVVPKKAVLSCDAFLSIGSGIDLSFEKDLLTLNKQPLICVDPILKDRQLDIDNPTDLLIEHKAVFNSNFNASIIKYRTQIGLKKLLAKILCKFIPSYLPSYLVQLLASIKKEALSVEESIGVKEYVSNIINTWELTTIEDLIDKYKLQEKKLGLILDINGSEQEAMNGVASNRLGNVQFLVLSLHNLHRVEVQKNIIHTINSIKHCFTLVHVHPINNSKLCVEGDITFTSSLECTFVHNSLVSKKQLQFEEINSRLDSASNFLLPEQKINYIEKLYDIAFWGDYSFFTHSDYFANASLLSKDSTGKQLPFINLLRQKTNSLLQWVTQGNRVTCSAAINAVKSNDDSKLLYYFSLISNLLPNSKLLEYTNINIALINTLEHVFRTKKLSNIVEQGCGLSTLVIAFLLKNQNAGKLICLEHDEKRAGAVREALHATQLNKFVEIKVIGLKTQIYDDLLWLWYDIPRTLIFRDIDLLLLSNTTEHIQLHSTFVAVPTLHAKITNRTNILVHGFQYSQKEIVHNFISKWRKFLEAQNINVDMSLAIFD